MPFQVLIYIYDKYVFETIISIKYDVANNQLDKFDQYKQDIDTFYDNIMEKNG